MEWGQTEKRCETVKMKKKMKKVIVNSDDEKMYEEATEEKDF
jgi:hypothetical protein